MKNLIVSENHKYFKVEDGCLFSKDGKELILCLMTNTYEDYTIPFGVETLMIYGIARSYNLKKVLIPNSVKTIDTYVFKFDSSLDTDVIPVYKYTSSSITK